MICLCKHTKLTHHSSFLWLATQHIVCHSTHGNATPHMPHNTCRHIMWTHAGNMQGICRHMQAHADTGRHIMWVHVGKMHTTNTHNQHTQPTHKATGWCTMPVSLWARMPLTMVDRDLLNNTVASVPFDMVDGTQKSSPFSLPACARALCEPITPVV